MSKPLSERELIQLQIQAYDFYAGLIDRAVGHGSGPKLPRWDEERALEYKMLADQLRQRLAELEARDPQALSRPGVIEIPTHEQKLPSAGGGEGDITAC
jgi:hypothetical protein